MMTLAEFLLFRIDEDEVDARYALRGVDLDELGAVHAWDWVHIYRPSGGFPSSSTFAGGAPSPDRVLAECEAKRRILAEHRADVGVDPCDAHDASFHTVDCDTLRLLALPYAAHPDFDVAWRL